MGLLWRVHENLTTGFTFNFLLFWPCQPLFPSRKIPSRGLSWRFCAWERLPFPCASRPHGGHVIESNSWNFDWVSFLQGIITCYFSMVILKFWANVCQDITALTSLTSDFQIVRVKYVFYVPADFRYTETPGCRGWAGTGRRQRRPLPQAWHWRGAKKLGN